MNKTTGLFSLSILMIAALSMFALAEPSPLCIDSDNGKDVWIGGTTTDFNGPNEVTNADDCDGASENLKEFYCDGGSAKLDNIKCSDYNAICVTVGDKTEADYCECKDGYEFSGDTCVPINNGDFCTLHPTDPQCSGGDENPGVPVFPSLPALGMAIVSVGLGLALLRKQQ